MYHNNNVNLKLQKLIESDNKHISVQVQMLHALSSNVLLQQAISIKCSIVTFE